MTHAQVFAIARIHNLDVGETTAVLDRHSVPGDCKRIGPDRYELYWPTATDSHRYGIYSFAGALARIYPPE